jgi:glycosyltransferase involved in cell wall biosynthesis
VSSGSLRFSVVIATLQRGFYLERALRSVLNQAGPDTELLVVDGGSTDETREILHRHDRHLTWWVSEPDAGQSAALNKGFARAQGEFLLWVNADDLLLPGTLDVARLYLNRQPECSWLAGNQIYIDDLDRVLWCARDGGWHDRLYRNAPVRVYGPTSFFRRSLWQQVGGLDESLRYGMDTDLWLRFKAAGARYQKVSHYCWAFRVHAGSRTTPDLLGRANSRMRAELTQIYRKNGLAVTRAGLWQQRIWRVLNGCYARAWYDTRRWQGKSVLRIARPGAPVREGEAGARGLSRIRSRKHG